MLFHKNLWGSPTLITNLDAAREWLQKKDESRLNIVKIERPNTKWSFAGCLQVEVKAVLTKQPMLGNGQLPDWLRNNMGICALDGYNDNLCLFRCLAVHRGARPDRCTEKAKQLAGKFYFNDERHRPEVYQKIKLNELKKVEKFKLGIRVYEPSENGPWRLTRQPAHYEAIGTAPMTIGFYGDHAFLIKHIKKVANIYVCAHCNQQFTKACNLQRHVAQKVKHKSTALEK